MEFITIKDARLPALGLGTWALNGRECFAAVKEALDLGYRHIDTAQIYGNEEEIGARHPRQRPAARRDFPHHQDRAEQSARRRGAALA